MQLPGEISDLVDKSEKSAEVIVPEWKRAGNAKTIPPEDSQKGKDRTLNHVWINYGINMIAMV